MKSANSLISGGALIITEEFFADKVFEKDSENSDSATNATYFEKSISTKFAFWVSLVFKTLKTVLQQSLSFLIEQELHVSSELPKVTNETPKHSCNLTTIPEDVPK